MTLNKQIASVTLLLFAVFGANAQGSFDLYSISQTDLRGTARFMSMAGAFGALGGDLSALSQNPGGIGVYRSSEIGVTLGGLKANTETSGTNIKKSQFEFNNLGYVGTFHTSSEATPTFSWGFSYNKLADFRRHYSGFINEINNSATNYVANQTQGWSESDLGAIEGGYDPYLQSNAPWMSILAYNSYLINPTATDSSYTGLFSDGTLGFAELEVEESGHLNEYSVSFGGNVYNKFMWGATLGIVDMTFSQYSYYGERLTNAHVPYVKDGNVYLGNGDASWGLQNYLDIEGTGVNFKFGAIYKPVNEFRIGLAFHTPTFYTLKSRYYANTSFEFKKSNLTTGVSDITGSADTNDGYYGETEFEARTPWHVIVSAAGVIGGRGIVSLDYERVQYNGMKTLYDGRVDKSVETNVQEYFKASNIIRIGGEFKITPKFSVRAGYSYQTSPVKEQVKNDEIDVITVGTTLNYTLDSNIQYITAGLGYRYKSFYVDMAYVHKQRNSDYHSFSSEANTVYPGVVSVKDSNNEVDFSIGFKF